MKKFFVAAIAAVMAVCVNAQDIYVGGSLGAWRDGTNHETTISILPEIGYNLSENTAIGTTIGWSYDHVKGASGNVFQIAPYFRYSFFKSERVSIFCDGGFSVGAGKTSYDDGDDSDTATIWSIGVKPGIALNLSDKCSLVAHVGFLGYEGANDAAKALDYSDQWGLNFDATAVTFGFYYTF